MEVGAEGVGKGKRSGRTAAAAEPLQEGAEQEGMGTPRPLLSPG